MLPFVRTTWEVEKRIKLVEEELLRRNNSFKVCLMAEVPSIVFLAEEFARLRDGFSIGSNDLTQLTLGIDRDSGLLGRMVQARLKFIRRSRGFPRSCRLRRRLWRRN